MSVLPSVADLQTTGNMIVSSVVRGGSFHAGQTQQLHSLAAVLRLTTSACIIHPYQSQAF